MEYLLSQYLNSRELAFSLVVLVSTYKAEARTKKQSENLARLARQQVQGLYTLRSTVLSLYAQVPLMLRYPE